MFPHTRYKQLKKVLSTYTGSVPFHFHLKDFFRQNKQMGSKDRKIASRLLYNFFRLGSILKEETTEERLIIAEFLCNDKPNSFLNHFKPEWEAIIYFAFAGLFQDIFLIDIFS